MDGYHGGRFHRQDIQRNIAFSRLQRENMELEQRVRELEAENLELKEEKEQREKRAVIELNGNGSIDGNSSCATDIDVWWINENGHYLKGSVTPTEYRNGEITITQADGTAIPNNNEGVYLNYWSSYQSFDTDMLRDAVGYLAAHYVIELRMTDVDRVTIADLATNMPVIVKNERRFYNAYRRKIKRVSRPKMGGI